MKYDTSGVSKIIKFKGVIQDIEPQYVQHLVSLSENVDLIQYEKYNYLLKLDKFLKFKISKKSAALENSKDSLSIAVYKELGLLNTSLREKIRMLNYKVQICEENPQVKKHIKKKTIVAGLDPDYDLNFVNLINSTIDSNKLNYDGLVKLEQKLIEKLELKKRKLTEKESFKLTSQEKNDLLLINELINESNARIDKFKLDKDVVKAPSAFLSSEMEVDRKPIDYFLKEIIMNSDTIQLSKREEEKIIVVNNTMYVFRNDSLVETIKNEDNTELASQFENAKPISVDEYDGLYYSIQIGTYSKEVTVKELKVRSNLFYKTLPNGNIRYSFGMYNNLEEVEQAKKTLEMIGVKDMVVIAYYQKERISIKQAKKMKSKSPN